MSGGGQQPYSLRNTTLEKKLQTRWAVSSCLGSGSGPPLSLMDWLIRHESLLAPPAPPINQPTQLLTLAHSTIHGCGKCLRLRGNFGINLKIFERFLFTLCGHDSLIFEALPFHIFSTNLCPFHIWSVFFRSIPYHCFLFKTFLSYLGLATNLTRVMF